MWSGFDWAQLVMVSDTSLRLAGGFLRTGTIRCGKIVGTALGFGLLFPSALFCSN